MVKNDFSFLRMKQVYIDIQSFIHYFFLKGKHQKTKKKYYMLAKIWDKVKKVCIFSVFFINILYWMHDIVYMYRVYEYVTYNRSKMRREGGFIV